MSKVKSYWLVCLVIISYILLLMGYLQDKISSNFFMGTLLVEVIVVGIWSLVLNYRKRVSRQGLLTTGMLLIIIAYEISIMDYCAHTFNLTTYKEPKEIVEGSNLYLMIVNMRGAYYIEDEVFVRNSFEQNDLSVLNIYPIHNIDRYRSKNNELLNIFSSQEKAFETMGTKVKESFGEDELHLQAFVEREDIDGNSAGLVLGLSELVVRDELQNMIPIGVTGTLEVNGDVRAIGLVKEKVQIAEEKGLHYLIVPRENFEEAEAAKQEFKLNLEIFSVKTIDEAVQVILELNQP